MPHVKTKNNPSIVVVLFFLLVSLIGLLIYKDYGVSWDEPIQRKYGLDVYNYVTKKDPQLLKNKERYYGPIFEFVLIGIEKTLALKDSRDIYLTRHLFTFYTFFIGIVFFYLLCKKLFASQKLGLLGSLLLVVSPRIFAHSFYNSKDIPLMVFFIISIYTAILLLEKPRTKTALLHALATALLIDIRILGVLVPILTIILFLTNKKDLRTLRIYLITTAILIVALWPTLWHNPVKNFVEAFKQMSKYPQSTTTLTLGKNLKSTDLPWYYIPVWIKSTTPIIYLLGFFIGVFYTFKKPKSLLTSTKLLILGWVFCPLIAVIVLKSTLYNGWRQMFFIYPGILIILMYGLTQIKKLPMLIITALLTINIASTIWIMFKLHPYQHIYFNKLVDSKKFELDYWGLSYKEGLQYILKTDNRPLIKVHVENLPGVNNYLILLPEERQRLTVEEKIADPNYLLTNKRSYSLPLVFSVEVLGNNLLNVYKPPDIPNSKVE